MMAWRSPTMWCCMSREGYEWQEMRSKRARDIELLIEDRSTTWITIINFVVYIDVVVSHNAITRVTDEEDRSKEYIMWGIVSITNDACLFCEGRFDFMRNSLPYSTHFTMTDYKYKYVTECLLLHKVRIVIRNIDMRALKVHDSQSEWAICIQMG